MRLIPTLLIIAATMVATMSPADDGREVTGDVQFDGESASGTVAIPGRGGVLTGKVKADGSGSYEVDLTKFETGIETRDGHMRDKYLETGKYPKATLVVDAFKHDVAEADWSGKLTLKGVTKPVKGKVAFPSKDKFRASFEVNIDDYPIGAPTFGDVVVSKIVKVVVTGQVK